MGKKTKKDTFWFYLILVVSVLMVNPPILYWFNEYCIDHPITLGWPTMYVWLEFWYVVMIADFLFCAWKLKCWDCSQDKKEIVPMKRKR